MLAAWLPKSWSKVGEDWLKPLSAFLFDPFREDQAFSIIKMALQATSFALDGFSSLRQSVGWAGLAVGRINAGSFDEESEGLLIGHCQVAFGALDVAFGFLEGMYIRRDWMLLLELEEVGNDAGPCGFFPTGLPGAMSGSGASLVSCSWSR